LFDGNGLLQIVVNTTKYVLEKRFDANSGEENNQVFGFVDVGDAKEVKSLLRKGVVSKRDVERLE
jgi:hypothetical protein